MYVTDNTKQASVLYVCTCLYRRCNHGDKRNEDGAEDVDNREDEIDLKKCICVNMTNQFNPNKFKTHLDWSFPLRVLPSKAGQTEDSQSDRELCGRTD